MKNGPFLIIFKHLPFNDVALLPMKSATYLIQSWFYRILRQVAPYFWTISSSSQKFHHFIAKLLLDHCLRKNECNSNRTWQFTPTQYLQTYYFQLKSRASAKVHLAIILLFINQSNEGIATLALAHLTSHLISRNLHNLTNKWPVSNYQFPYFVLEVFFVHL